MSPGRNANKEHVMELTDNRKPLTLDGQYIAKGNIGAIRLILFDLLNKHFVMYRVKSCPHLIGPADEFDHLCLINPVWGEFGELELIDLGGNQTLVRFYQPGLPDLPDIKERESAIRKNLYRPAIELWFFDNLGWPAKIIDFFAEELLDHRFACLREIQDRLVSMLALIPYQLSYFQVRQVPEVGISPFQPVAIQPEEEIIRDIPKKAKSEVREISLHGDNQELLRLWAAGLTAKQIGLRTGKTEKTILNKLTVLRKAHGEELVPRRK
jgi:hypothetical protein